MVFFFLILRYIKKWPLTERAGWWMAERDDFKRGYWSRVEIPTRMQFFFLLILVYKLTSTNSYMLLRLYQFVHFLCDFCTNSYIFYTNCIVRIHTTSCERAARAARAKPEHTSCPDQAASGCPDVRVHPAAPTLGYTRLPRALGYTWLPRC
jgi:hypothetical protein